MSSLRPSKKRRTTVTKRKKTQRPWRGGRDRVPRTTAEIDPGVHQVKCWIASAGHIWMRGYFDNLPSSVRRRLQDAPFNLCAACLVTEFLPEGADAPS